MICYDEACQGAITMANCPRCGAVNQDGKAACWKCMAPIPAVQSTRPTPSISARDRELSAPVRRKFNIPDLTIALPKRRANPGPDVPVEPIELEDAGEIKEPIDEPAAPREEPTELKTEPDPAPEAIFADESTPASLPHETVPLESAADAISPPLYDKTFDRADDEEEPTRPHLGSEFSYIARTVSTRTSTTWIVLLVLLALLLSGIFIFYHYEFSAQHRPITAQQAAQEYILALRMKQETTRQQLATLDSRGLLLPAWFIISEAIIVSVTETGENVATARARITLAPVRSIDLQRELEKAASSDYNVEFTLERDGRYWLVDQRALFRSLRRQLKAQNPGVTFPSWDGVAE